MKAFIGFLLLAIVCTSVRTNSCMAMNPFLASLATSDSVKVQIYDQPRKDIPIDHCQAEWEKYGACCDQDDLILSNYLESRLIDLNVEFLAKVVKDKAAALSSILIQTKSYFANHAPQSTKDKFKEIINSSHVVNFQENSKKCWDFMKAQRSSAICSICSGRSSIYFNQGKILVSQHTCLGAASKCHDFFLSLRAIDKSFADIKPLLLEQNLEEMYIEITFFLILLDASGPPDELVKAFEEYTNARRSLRRTSDYLKRANALEELKKAEATTCSMILNIRKTPFIMSMNPGKVKEIGDVVVKKLKLKYSNILDSLTKRLEGLEKTQADDIKKVIKLTVSLSERIEKVTEVNNKAEIKKKMMNRRILKITNEINGVVQDQAKKTKEAAIRWEVYLADTMKKIKEDVSLQFTEKREEEKAKIEGSGVEVNKEEPINTKIPQPNINNEEARELKNTENEILKAAKVDTTPTNDPRLLKLSLSRHLQFSSSDLSFNSDSRMYMPLEIKDLPSSSVVEYHSSCTMPFMSDLEFP